MRTLALHLRPRRWRASVPASRLARLLPFALLASAARAALVCDAPEFDFGARPDTDLGFSHTFDVRNAGAAPVVISAVRTSCDCLAATLTRQSLRPGERVPVDAHFTFRGESGPQFRAVHLAYGSEGTPEGAPAQVCSLGLRGSILTPVIRLPNRLDLGLVLPGSVATGTVALLAGRCGPFALRAVALSASGARADFAPGVTATNHPIRLLIPVPPNSGPFTGLAVVTTDLPETPNVPIQYAGRAVPFLEVRPGVVAAPRIGQPLRARLTVTSPYGAAFRLLSAVATDPRVSVTVVPEGTNTAVTVSAEAQPESLDGTLVRLTTDHPVCRMLEVPIRAAPIRRPHTL